jgi:tetraacyldisaccharide 4'-kinase
MEALGAFEDRLFPMGRLRESYTSLKRADILIFTKADALSDKLTGEFKKSLSEKAKLINPDLKIFFAKSIFRTSLDLNGKKIFPVSSIYDPKYFHMNLKKAGAVFERYMAFRDHYAYDEKTVKMIIDNAKSVGAKYVLLTSKDWVKVKPILGGEAFSQSFNPAENMLDGAVQFVESYYEHDLEKEEEFLTCCI